MNAMNKILYREHLKCDLDLIKGLTVPLLLMSTAGITAAVPVLDIDSSREGIAYFDIVMGVLIIGILSFDTLTDMRYMIIFNKANLLLGCLGAIDAAVKIIWKNLTFLAVYDLILGAFIGGGVLLIIRIISRGGIGAGDVKLMTAGGICLGADGAAIALEIAFLAGAVFGILYILYKKGMGRTGDIGRIYIPFGPFVAFGIYCCYFYGSYIMDVYRSMVYG